MLSVLGFHTVLMMLLQIISVQLCEVSLTTNRTIVELDSSVAMTCRVCTGDRQVVLTLKGVEVATYWRPVGPSVNDGSAYSVSFSILNNITYISLTILSFTADKAGVYACFIEQTQPKAFVEIAYAVAVSNVELKPRLDKVSILSNVPTNIFSCTSSPGRPTPVIRWYMDNKTPGFYGDDSDITSLSTNITTSNVSGDTTTSHLKLTPSTEDQGMTLYCNVSNGYEQIMSADSPILDILQSPSKPVIYHQRKTVDDKYTVLENQTVSLNCTSVGNPNPTVTWSSSMFFTRSDPLLLITNIQTKDTGMYTCRAYSTLSPTNSLPIEKITTTMITVEVLYPPRPPECRIGNFNVVSNVLRAISNESFRMTCTSNSNPTPSNYTWTIPHGAIVRGKELSIGAVQPSGDNIYTIRIVNMMNPLFEQSVEGSIEQRFTLDVLYPVSSPAIYYVGPNTEIEKLYVLRGQSIHLQCNSSSNPPPKYLWSIKGVVSAQEAFWNRTIENNAVVICNVSNCMDPTGNTMVCSSKQTYLNITTYFPPEKPVLRFTTCNLEVIASTIKIIEGQSVNVSCTSLGNPEPKFEWNSSFYDQGNIFTLENVNASQNGTYSCTATNDMNTTVHGMVKGTNASVFYVHVLVSPRVHSIENVTVLLNTNLSVECPYTVGNPPSTTVVWMRENGKHSLGPTLSITGIKLTDEGKYTCSASNTMEPTLCNSQTGYTEASFSLDVQYAANITRYFASGFENQHVIIVNENESVQFVCVFESDPVANISIINGTRILGSGQTNKLMAHISQARCEYDATVYTCQGGNTHSREIQERVIQVFIKCAPRPSPFSLPVTSISKIINGSVVLTLTIKAYPTPDKSAYAWYRLKSSIWEIITNLNSYHMSVSEDGLQTNLTISRLQSADFGRYLVSVYNELGNVTQEYELKQLDKPKSPYSFQVKDGTLGVDSFTVEWKPGFNGGEEQTFILQYKAKHSTLQWTDVNVSSNTFNYTFVGLESGTEYLIKMLAQNVAGKSDETGVITVTTLSNSETRDSVQLTAGIVGGSVSVVMAAIVVVVVVIIIIRKRKVKESASQYTSNRSSKRLKQPKDRFTDDENIGMVNTPEPRNQPANKNDCQKEKNPVKKVATGSIHITSELKRTNSFAIERDPIYDNLIKERNNFKSRDISIQHFRKTVTDAKYDPTDVFIEFSKLSEESEKIKYSTDAARTPANVSKSRYKNMFPYDKNRVLLPIIDCDEDSDFINASFINGYSLARKYIAAQGPLSSTIADTWRMIWAENIRVVAMVTNLVEDSKRKCFQYWPDNVNERCQYESYSVAMLTEDEYADFVVRKLQCSKEGSRDIHTVTHCHFTSWPDKNVPDTALSFIQFWRKVRSVGSEDNTPWMVHCSAGVGGTGTFIALDYLYDQGIAEKQVNLFDAIIKLREQRINMVQTKLQYLYLHEVACEALCPVGDISKKNIYLGSIKPNDILNKEFEILEHATIPDFLDKQSDDDYSKILDGEKPENKRKNIDPDVIPEDKYRPVLNMFFHVKGHNDYINAVYVSTYLERNKLILTQSTPSSTEIDFVRLLHDHYVKTVVTFCDQVHSVVPINDKVLVMGPFAATLVSSSTTENYKEGVVVYKRIGEQHGFEVRALQFTKWPKNAHVCDAEDLVNFVINIQKCANEGPVVIQCHDGYTQSGLFAVIWCIVERLKCDRDVALAETVRMIRKRRKQIITNVTQYSFCHECAKHFIKGCDDYMNV